MSEELLEYDVVVVGAGPAGSNAAYECAKNGYKVVILEEDPVVGVPVQCGEGLSCFALQHLDIKPDDGFVSANISRLRVIFTNGNWMSVHDGGYELDRDKFDQFLVKRATDAGSELLTSAKVIEFDSKEKILKVTYNKKIMLVKAKIVIGADGPKSNIAAWSGLLQKDQWRDKLIRAYELKMEGVDVNGFDMYFDVDIAPGGYVWVFQKGENIANVGIATTAKDTAKRLDKFIQQKKIDGKVIGKTAGAIPYKGPLEKTYADGILIAGDAAGSTNPVFLGGISTAMQTGSLAGKTAAESLKADDFSEGFLSRYQKRWKKLPLADKSLLETAKVMHEFTPEMWEKMGELVGKSDLTNITAFGKLRVVLKAFYPKYWSLIPVVPYMPTVMKAFSITRKWGW